MALDRVRQPNSYRLYYAGPCPVCHRLVGWMARHSSSRAEFNFHPLPENEATWLEVGLPAAWWSAPESVVIQDLHNGRWHRESDAVILAFKCMDAPYSALGFLGKMIPKFIRDWCYRKLRPSTSLRPKH